MKNKHKHKDKQKSKDKQKPEDKQQQKSEEQSLAKKQKEPMHWPGSFDEMERWFEKRFPMKWRHQLHQEWPSWGDLPAMFEGRKPSIDVIDREDKILVRAEIPGVDKKDLVISVTDNTVSIKGSVEHEKEEEKGDYYSRETSSGTYARILTLPCAVESENAKASFKRGVLELTLPKHTSSKGNKVTVE